MARRRRAAGAGAGAGPGAATNRFQFREELGGLKVMGVDFWSGVQAILPCPALPLRKDPAAWPAARKKG